MSVSISVGDEAAAGAREEFARSLRPLSFGAAYKVLDLLVEHVLIANGRPPDSVRRFDQKSAALAQRPANLPVPLDARPDLWDRLVALYKELLNARHAVTHRRAQATSGGDIEVYDDQGNRTDTVSSSEIHSFTAAVHAIAELVIDGQSDDRRLNIVAWHVNELQPRHKLQPIAVTDPAAGLRVLEMDLDELEDGSLRFDVPQAEKHIDSQPAASWDLRLYAGQRVFVGRWEDVTDRDAPFDFHPASPPNWLSEEIST
jgi:hypothetical protein